MTPLELANYMQTIRLPYNLNTLSQVAAEAAFDDQAFLTRTISQNAEERAKWENLFDELGIHYYKSEANFIFFAVPDAEGLSRCMAKKGYQVRRGQREGWLRLTIPMAPRWSCYARYIKTIHELINMGYIIYTNDSRLMISTFIL